jgi:hypothetical protein
MCQSRQPSVGVLYRIEPSKSSALIPKSSPAQNERTYPQGYLFQIGHEIIFSLDLGMMTVPSQPVCMWRSVSLRSFTTRPVRRQGPRAEAGRP